MGFNKTCGCSTPSIPGQNNSTLTHWTSPDQQRRDQPQIVELPQLRGIAFRVLAEGLVWSRARGHGARRGPRECGWWGLGNLLSQVADPFLLLILGQSQQEHVPGRGHIVVYCGGGHEVLG